MVKPLPERPSNALKEPPDASGNTGTTGTVPNGLVSYPGTGGTIDLYPPYLPLYPTYSHDDTMYLASLYNSTWSRQKQEHILGRECVRQCLRLSASF